MTARGAPDRRGGNLIHRRRHIVVIVVMYTVVCTYGVVDARASLYIYNIICIMYVCVCVCVYII